MLTDREAQHIVFQSELSENLNVLSKKLACAPKLLRQELIHTKGGGDERRVSAAIEIQRVWRGYLARSNLFEKVQPGTSKTAVYSGSKHAIVRQDDFRGLTQSAKKPGRVRLENYYQEFRSHLLSLPDRPTIIPSFKDFCATYIQDWWRDIRMARRQLQQERRQLIIEQQYQQQQQQQQAERTEPRVKSEVVIPKRISRPLSLQEAASKIQKAWRRHIDIQVYRYYRDLINFKSRGNPSLMLRCINPQEAKMLDAASGIHVKFRLAGERFPPNIYYKIYTHRPIQDLCANSPKDYTSPGVKLKMAKDQHNRGRLEVNTKDTTGWYQRMDNNSWRLVSDRLIHHIMADPVTWETSHKKYQYHHDKLVRKQDVEKRKKKKKIDWMKKMYKDGMLKAKSDDKETIQLIEGAAAGMVATVENYGPDALEDWEVDELLDWTTSLNFDDYQSGWKELATSAHSEKQIEDKLRLLTSTADPYEFSLSGASRYQSTQQSRNTPVSSISSTGARPQPVS
ncbi:protein MFI-like isoform X2 [Dreissena polymorpha]|uniref:protein MFI-like isoform X2 n=1 Tax=Dreissena polymorpha TaxID=45954 RepID=UPI0022640C8D|nr:protein MFI-like isoform X2 [Dreissena polymorpha]